MNLLSVGIGLKRRVCEGRNMVSSEASRQLLVGDI
jgi:hypothetical protein